MLPQYSQVSAPATHPLTLEAFDDISETSIWWLSGGGFLINSHGTLIMIDPVISMKPGSDKIHETGLRMLVPLPIRAEDVPRLDAVLYTHADLDHIGTTTPLDLVRLGTKFSGTLPVVGQLEKLGVPLDQTHLFRIGEKFKIGSVNITVTPADHPWQLVDPIKNGAPWGPGDCCGFVIHTQDGTIWCTGDTRILPAHLGMTGIDLLLLDVSNDPFHLGKENAILLANTLINADLIPYHYGTYDAPNKAAHNGDPTGLVQNIVRSASRLHIFAPGEKYTLNK